METQAFFFYQIFPASKTHILMKGYYKSQIRYVRRTLEMLTIIIITLIIALVMDRKIDWSGAMRDKIHGNKKETTNNG